MSYAPIFCSIKGLMKINNRSKFNLYSIFGCQVKNFQMFSWWYSIHEIALFVVFFLDSDSPKCCQILPKFLPELVLKGKQTVFKEFWKNSNLKTGDTESLHVWCNFDPFFSPRRWPKSRKLKNFKKNQPSGYPNM